MAFPWMLLNQQSISDSISLESGEKLNMMNLKSCPTEKKISLFPKKVDFRRQKKGDWSGLFGEGRFRAPNLVMSYCKIAK